MRASLVKFCAAGLAAASLGAFALPTYAGTSQQNDPQAQQAWCDVVPPFCGCNNNVQARCRPGPCQVTVQGPRARDGQGICKFKNEE